MINVLQLKEYIYKESAFFDKDTGISTAIINTDCGVFKGTAKLADADKEYPSRFVGCDIALTRAHYKYVKVKYNIVKAQFHFIQQHPELDTAVFEQYKTAYEFWKIHKETYIKLLKTLTERRENEVMEYVLAVNNIKAKQKEKEQFKEVLAKCGQSQE